MTLSHVLVSGSSPFKPSHTPHQSLSRRTKPLHRASTVPFSQVSLSLSRRPLPSSRLLPPLAALNDDAADRWLDSTDEENPAYVAAACMQLFCQGDTETVISYLPDALIDSALERKKSNLALKGHLGGMHQPPPEPDLTFQELLELAPASDFTADSFAMRGLVFSPPQAAEPLSTLRVSPSRYLQRYRVVSASEEEMRLALELQMEDSCEPIYRGFGTFKRWRLRGMTGESPGPEAPSRPSPRHGPEAVVTAQLDALKKGSAAGVFKFASPRNREAVGGNVERFSAMLESGNYAPLLRHAGSEILRSQQLTMDRNFVVVGVTAGGSGGGAPQQKMLYGWALALQGESAGPLCGCWLTESVYPLGQHLMGGGNF